MECQTLERYDNDLAPIYKPKKSFDTLEEAIKVAKVVNSQDHIIHKVVAYKCKKCHKFHLGRSGKILTTKERDKFKRSLNKSFC